MTFGLPHLSQEHQPSQQEHPDNEIRMYIPPLPELHKPIGHEIHEFGCEAQQAHGEVPDSRRESLDCHDHHEDVAHRHRHADEDVARHYYEVPE